MMSVPSFNISTKIYVTSSLGIVMVIAMLTSDYLSREKIFEAERVVTREQTILHGIETAQKAYLTMTVGVRDVSSATSLSELDVALAQIDLAAKTGEDALKGPIEIAMKPEVLRDMSESLAAYATASRTVGDYLKKANFGDRAELRSVLSRSTAPINAALSKAVDQSLANARQYTEEAKATLSSSQALADSCAEYLSAATFDCSPGRPK